MSWLDELQVEPGPPWHAMGTRALNDGWLIVDDERDDQLGYKRRLLHERHDVVRAARPGTEAEQAEAARLVAGVDDLGAAALQVQEDLCVLVRRDEGWCLDAGVVCFPSMWSLPDKLGRPMAEVHGPVPAYAEELAAKVDRFLDRLQPDRPVWRRNWFVHDSPELHLPEPPAHLDAPRVPDDLWLRSERQTLRRLPATGAILFTIRTQQVPLAAVPADVGRRLAGAVRAWSAELVDYRGAGPWRQAFLAHYGA